MEYLKTKTPAKQVTVKSDTLDNIILNTMKTISDIVGGTLGPGGQPVLIERFEYGIGPMVTKDGVTVFKHLGFTDATAHCIMEAARDAAVGTANVAGDGTTCCTVLSESIVRRLKEYCKLNPTVSPQKVVRELEELFNKTIEPTINKWSKKVTLNTEKDKKVLWNVAKISANGDTDLADAVMECYNITGDAGNVSITEAIGPSRYEVEKIEGYPIDMGYDDSTLKFQHKFIDPGTGAVVMDHPKFILYNGKITEIQVLENMAHLIGQQFETDPTGEQGPNFQGDPEWENVVVVANGFSESVIGNLAINFATKNTIRVFPLLAPLTPQHNGQQLLLQDLQAITGGTIFDPMSHPLELGSLDDLGVADQFQCGRTKSVVLGYADTDLLEARIEEVERMLKKPESQLDEMLLRERMAKLSGGIAKLRVWGSANGELKEKKDRAEDAVCAVRGAIKSGVLPGGGTTLLLLSLAIDPKIPGEDKPINNIMVEALKEPFWKLCSNSGLNKEEAIDLWGEMVQLAPKQIYDFQEHEMVDPFKAGILDSTPAVLEAIRNSLSIASLLGTLGGTVVQRRDHEFDMMESASAMDFDRNAHRNFANEHG